ncbi:hypothetical protein S40285_01694 [Stachybotrys chlorohalonatus IBT 40285]|uniref:Sugar phosphate transporter domain-containing protein n=1 Tax=Stachybotrys chlorohalonatus (strain IBT 40285) TaxID=1283841 RepID=A0A084QE09_STAC4|nr:hypothetical protein S40285_01694 [Stachybotrys chlorohalonata IBT 40285]
MANSSNHSDTELPVTDKPEPKPKGMHPALYILNWILFSNLTILFNKWLIDSAGFRYPILLTTWHLIFATAATQLLARFTTLLDSRRTLPITGRFYLRTIVPIGFCYSGSLVCSNVVYLYLSVAFIQMLKAASPVAVLFCSWIWRVADPSLNKFLNILVIVFGVGLASAGEVEFSMVGFLYQVAGTIFEAIRLVMIQVMLSSEGMKMDPLVSLYYYAPVCAVMNLIVAIPTEIPKFMIEDLAKAGYGMLLLNAIVAFMLNIASVFLIGKTSGLVMTLTGILKNILLVVISVMIWNTRITGLQTLGYAVALGGLTYYSLGYDQLEKGWTTSKIWASKMWHSELPQGGLAVGTRRFIIIGLASITTLILAGGLLHGTGVAGKGVDLVHSWLDTGDTD